MLQLDSLVFSVGIHPVKPGVNTLIKSDLGADLPEVFLPDGKSSDLGMLDQLVHPCEVFVHQIISGDLIGFLPEILTLHPEGGDQGEGLHIVRRQGFIEIVANRNFWFFVLFHSKNSFSFILTEKIPFVTMHYPKMKNQPVLEKTDENIAKNEKYLIFIWHYDILFWTAYQPILQFKISEK